MAAKKTTKEEVATSQQESVKETMRKLGVKKVYVSPDGYIFPLEADARAYVGKTGSYETVTEEDTDFWEDVPVTKTGSGSKELDMHTHIDETDNN